MRIALVTPAGARARNGNRHTALRWAAFLRAAGHRVAVSTQWPGSDADLLLALHARRSYDSIRRFAASYPQRRLLVALTGTDIYRDIRISSEARESLALAHRLITLQPMAAAELPAPLRRKVSVVVQSSATTLRLGVPVLASRIAGNVGLLGKSYPAYFAVEDERDLAGLIHRAVTDKRFYAKLKRQVARLRPMVAPRAEARALLDALKADPSGSKS